MDKKFGPQWLTGSSTVLLLALVLITYLFLATTWICDDAYITFRVSDNLVNGYGPVWNVGERVQSYTNPLWMLAVAVFHFVLRDVYLASQLISLACVVALMIIAWQRRANLYSYVIFFLLVTSSKAFIDYTSSGLENPLTFLLLALFYTRLMRFMKRGEELTSREYITFLLIASLGFVNRMDTVLLYLPALLVLTWQAWKKLKWHFIVKGLIGVSPAIAWLLFSLVYYGFIFPNTFYAKLQLGLPEGVLFKQGIAYMANNLANDPVTLTATLTIAFLALLTRRPLMIATGFAPLLYLLYTMNIGGDFMAGRFLGAPFLIAAVMLLSIEFQQRHATIALAVFAGVLLVVPLAPWKMSPQYEAGWYWRQQNAIHDEIGGFHDATNILGYAPMHDMFDRGLVEWTRRGPELGMSDIDVVVMDGIGIPGYYAGPEKFIIDQFGLSDPLLARLPVDGRFLLEYAPGHYLRRIPEGYEESIRQDKNLIADPELREYYEGIRTITRGPLFSGERLAAMWRYNLGDRKNYDFRPDNVVFSVLAGHRRLQAYSAGNQDSGRQIITSNGTAGILQTGPGVPLLPGRYRVIWRGTFHSAPHDLIGFADVSTEAGRRVFRRIEVKAPAVEEDGALLAEIDFELKEGQDAVDFRFYVKEGVRLTLQRLTLRRLDEGE